ncbi:MAG: enoyl-CoA hydratase/isomerase family protein [Desulfobacteraceae bacterium]|nr:enoyl-CoA hydratase/isomerase family protein [Desulfobacteraceae bacterium]
MGIDRIHEEDGVVTVTLNRGKVNAITGAVVEEMHNTLSDLEHDTTVRAVILTGHGNFFSFGFDIPEFLSYSKEEFTKYLIKFTNLYTYMFLYPKPIIAALNGHTIAGGCMLALACDYRIMVSEKAKISLNEISFGSSVFAGSAEMLRFCVGSQKAAQILYSGALYTADEAKELGLVDDVRPGEELLDEVTRLASDLSNMNYPAFRSIKFHLRKPVADEMRLKEKESIKEFVDIWYSDSTWEKLKDIKIY